MLPILRIVRPHQWAKNIFVPVPLFFGGALTDPRLAGQALAATAAFSLAASSVYCLNDIVDAEADRRHPAKCDRPIACGAVSVATAYALMAVLIVASMALCLLTGEGWATVAAIIGGYWILNIGYCTRLKQHAIVDVCVIAFGFVLRILAGGAATGVALSKWIVLMTFLLTLFLSLAKRRDDVLRMNSTGVAPRKNTSRYNLTFINQSITITATVTIVCYVMYTVSPEVQLYMPSDYLYLTSILVIIGLLRYIQITVVDCRSGDPTRVMLHDRALQVIVLLWALTFAVMIYF